MGFIAVSNPLIEETGLFPQKIEIGKQLLSGNSPSISVTPTVKKDLKKKYA